MATENERTPILEDDVLYIDADGRCFCGRHAEEITRVSGGDAQGRAVAPLTAHLWEAYESAFGHTEKGGLRCWEAGCPVLPPGVSRPG